ncbi:hypothetical protein HID58_005022, partial [Brassica napus]
DTTLQITEQIQTEYCKDVEEKTKGQAGIKRSSVVDIKNDEKILNLGVGNANDLVSAYFLIKQRICHAKQILDQDIWIFKRACISEVLQKNSAGKALLRSKKQKSRHYLHILKVQEDLLGSNACIVYGGFAGL